MSQYKHLYDKCFSDAYNYVLSDVFSDTEVIASVDVMYTSTSTKSAGVIRYSLCPRVRSAVH